MLSILILAAQPIWPACIGINCSCSVSAISAVSFNNYNPLSGNDVNANGSISVTCSALLAGLNVSYVIALNAGQNGTLTTRRLILDSSLLNYNLYTTNAFTTIWGDGSVGTATISDSYTLNLISSTRSYTVYGRLPASQNVKAGTYNDIVTVTVTY